MDASELRQQFLKEPIPRRLGNLASTLHRMADFIEIRRPEQSVLALIDEAEHFVRWTQPELDSDRAVMLDKLLAELDTWRPPFRSASGAPEARLHVEGQARVWTSRIIEVSGLIP